MILCTFQRGTEMTVVKIQGKNLVFGQMKGANPIYTTIEGLKLNPATIIKEFPDLEGKPINEIKKEAVARLKQHIKTMKSEFEIKDYVNNDLKKHGYKMIMWHKQGWRPIRVRSK
jgi:hypothetical protein